MRGWTVVLVAMVCACGTEPTAPVELDAGSGDVMVVWLPEAEPAATPMERVPLVEVYGRFGLGQCGPCITESGHGCCGTDGWTGPVACGNAQGYLMDCRQVPTGCGQTLVAGVRACE